MTEGGTKQHHDVEYQRRDVTETANNRRRDIEISRRDVPESVTLNVATFGATSRRDRNCGKSTLRHWDLTSRRDKRFKNKRRDVGIPRRDVLETLKINVATLEIDSCHSRVSEINKICFLCSSYCRSQATAA